METRIARSGLYVLVGSVGTKALALGRNIVIARLLVPEELGRFALAAATLGVLDALSEPGLRNAAIQADHVTERQLRAVWNALLLRNLVLVVAVWALTPTVVDVLDAPQSASLMRLLAIVPLCRGLASMSLVLRERAVDFAPFTRLRVTGQLVETAVAVAAVAITNSAAGIAVGVVAGVLFESLASYAVAGFRPSTGLAWSELRPLLRFGRWVFFSNGLEYLSTNGDDVVLGTISGTGPLGIYRVAYRVANAPTTEISHVAGRVAFPAFARRQGLDPEFASAAFTRVLTVSVGLSAPAAAIIAGTSEDLVLGLLGSQWREAIAPVTILAAAGYLRSIAATGGPLFLGLGRPELDTHMQVIRTVVLFTGLTILVRAHGAVGASVASLASVAVLLPVWGHGLRRVGFNPTRALTIIGRSIPAPAAAGGVAFVASSLVEGHLQALIAGVTCGLITWAILVRLLDRPLFTELRGVVRSLRQIGAA